MAKAATQARDSALRSIPSVERILSSWTPLVEAFGRERVKDHVVEYLGALRSSHSPYDEAAARDAIGATLATATSSTLRRVINASGVIIHTNLGRAPIDEAIWAQAEEIVSGYSNLEFDLERGERGARDEHLTAICKSLFGCEAAVLTNNNAAGTMLTLAAVAAGKEVLVSRGELVEIGGAFRVPDVIQQGGAKLHEVGTTNRTRTRDYAAAISKKTAAILRVHRSNFDIVGFTETPPIAELVGVVRASGAPLGGGAPEARTTRRKRIPLLYDEGSGRIVDLARYGFASAPTIRELIAGGVDAVTCSTDKLIGATQGGLIIGSEAIIGRIRKHPLMRALRVGKETYAVVAATLRAFATEKHEERIPIYRMLATPLDTLRARAESLTRDTNARVIESQCALGGGTTPTETIPSIAIEVAGNANELYARFLRESIVGRIVNDRFTLEVRTLLGPDLPRCQKALSESARATR
ncbi:MAG TPA: L-seryl-tRNA(Sec) selenium transferase [Thermoanaerobaculia bacterium]|nr:L-seryl-tRNA(Sec) selenium transferase [Thermoanaerobaculia bacterium]